MLGSISKFVGASGLSGGLGFKDVISLLSGHNFEQATKTQDSETIAQLDNFKQGLAEHFRTSILPQQQQLEANRLAKLAQLKNYVFIASLVSVVTIALCAAAMLYLSGENADFDAYKLPGVISIIIISGVFYWATAPAREYCKLIKDEVFGKIISFLGEKFSFNFKSSIQAKLTSSDILPQYDTWKSDDIICGEHDGVSIEIEECKLTYTSGSGKHRRTVTSFRGIMVLLSMNKNFNGKTVVKADSGGVGNWLSDKFSDKETIHLEDPQFEKMFQVYASDQIEARYLLTTAFMDRLIKLRESFGAGGIEGRHGDFQCSFFANQLLITIPLAKNMFEPKPITEPALQTADVLNFLEEIFMIFEIIDQLKLNMKIGL